MPFKNLLARLFYLPTIAISFINDGAFRSLALADCLLLFLYLVCGVSLSGVDVREPYFINFKFTINRT